MGEVKRLPAKQTVSRGESGGMPEVKIHEANHTPSWKVYGDGYANFRVYGCDKWLSLTLAEGYQSDKRYTVREAMMTLDRPAAIALRDLLNEIYPD